MRTAKAPRSLPSRAGRALLLAFLGAAALWLCGSACDRPCQQASNCVRECSCLNSVTDTRIACPLAFRCEREQRRCEDAFAEMGCDEMCERYASRGLCGTERCRADDECRKFISCPVLNDFGEPSGLFRDCTLNFVCDVQAESCDPASTLDDFSLCQICDEAAAGQ
jgi:hypothetical protein